MLTDDLFSAHGRQAISFKPRASERLGVPSKASEAATTWLSASCDQRSVQRLLGQYDIRECDDLDATATALAETGEHPCSKVNKHWYLVRDPVSTRDDTLPSFFGLFAA